MAGFPFRCFLFFCLVRLSQGEYKICATAEYEASCKAIEASGNDVTCARVSDSVDCLLKMQKNEADLGTFYLEEAFLAERFLGKEGVVLSEVRHPEREDSPFGFETVAVVRKTLFGGLSGLKGMSYCHPGFSKAQYWSDRVLKDFERRVLEHFKDDVKCNAAMRSAYEDDLHRLSLIFSKACRPGTWAVSDWWDKKLKKEYHTLCEQCEHPTTCSYDVRNRGRHSDALRCLTHHGGNVTYTALEFVREYFNLDSDKGIVPHNQDPFRYNYLCPDGSTVPLTSPEHCSWIKQPWTSVIALEKGGVELQKKLKEWVSSSAPSVKYIKNILAKGNGVLKFREKPVVVADYIKEGRSIPSVDDGSCRNGVKWCTVNREEKKKCEYVSTAALAHGLPTRVECVEGASKIDCLEKISTRAADVVYIDSELGYISRKVYNLTAVAYLETQRSGNYYGVIVVKGNSVKKLKELRGKRACFPQYNGLGWLTFVEFLKSISEIPRRSCPNVKKAFNFFSEVCAPGAKDPRVSFWSDKVPERLCKGCGGARGAGSCAAEPTNPYFGEIGALKCLQNDADVAFLDYNTIHKYLASTRQNSSDSGIQWENLKILCRDGTVEGFNLTTLDQCSFTQLSGGEVVSRNDLEPVQEADVRHTLMELDDLFGTTSRSYNPAIKMFEPFDGQPNLLFKDSAVNLVSVYQTQNRFVNNYMKLLNGLEGCHGDSSSSTVIPSIFVIAFTIFFIFQDQ